MGVYNWAHIRKIKKWLLLPLLFTFHFSLFTSAQNTAHMLGLGGTELLDTYISQEHFTGAGLTYLYTREKIQEDRRWNSFIEHEVSLAFAEDRSGNMTMIQGDYNLYWGRYYRLPLLDGRLVLQGGGAANLCLGYLYDTTTSNNPAQARASLNVMPSAIISYAFPLFKKPGFIRYEANLPLVGVMFSPNYGQSYYEIFNRGNYDHNIVPTTFVSAPNFRQQIYLEWQTSAKWAFRIGYLGNIQQAAVNNLKQHVYTHRVMIGIVRNLEVKSEK